MRFDPTTESARDAYRLLIALITPRPIAWVSTISDAGQPNLAPFSFFTGIGAAPPALAFSVVNRRDGSIKDTIRNLRSVPELVVNVVSHDQAIPMNISSDEVPPEVNEFELAGLAPAPSERVRPPRVAAARAHMECVVHQIVEIGSGPLAANLVIARIVLIDVADDALDETGAVDPARIDSIGRMGSDLYARTTDRFRLPRPGGDARTRPFPPK